MPKQNLVQTWLAAIGLSPQIVETFDAAGIVNPKDLAELEVCHYPALGVKNAADRKKLFYLVQRVKMAVPGNEEGDNDEFASPASGWQHAGERTGVNDSRGSNDQYNDSFEIDGNVDDDDIDEVLQEQYEPLLRDSSDEESFHSASVDFSSDEELPSPPFTPTRQNHSYRDDGTPPSENKKEVEFLKRRAARLEKVTPPRKAVPTILKSPRDTPESSGQKKKKKNRRTSMKHLVAEVVKSPFRTMGISQDEDDIDSPDPSHSSKSTTTTIKVKRQASSSPSKRKSGGKTRREMLAKLRAGKSKDESSSAPKMRSPKKAFDMGPIGDSLSEDVNVAEHPKTSRRSKRLEEKLTDDRISISKTMSPSSESGSIGNDAQSLGSRSRKSASSRGDTLPSRRTRTSSAGSSRSGASRDKAKVLGSSVAKMTSSGATVKVTAKERKSRLQSPPSRENKRLSTIPSDRPSIMSPVQVTQVSANDIDESLGDDIESVKSGSSRSSRKSSQKTRVRTSSSDDRSFKSSSSNPQARSSKSRLSAKAARAKSTPKGRMSSSHNKPPSKSDPPTIDTLKSKSFEEFGMKEPVTPKSTKPNTSSGVVFVHGGQTDKSWTARVGVIREANNLHHEDEMKSLHDDKHYEEEMRIRVVIRKRPMSKKEAAKKDEVDVIHPLRYPNYGKVLVYQAKTRVDLTKEVESVPFAFDNVFAEESNNCQIYDETIRPLIPGAFEGRWASVFAYGQTGSGKTFTMMGSTLTGIKARSKSVQHDKNYGLYVLAARDIFEFANREENSHLSVGASLFEIYGGKLFDLLNDRNPVKCLENHKGKVCFPGLSEHPITSADGLIQLIEAGSNNRSTGSTSANRDSSRSHAVLQLHLRKTMGKRENVEHGRLTFIDLAGSERGADTNKASRTTRLEGADINTSLLALKEVIRALATGDSMTHIPFRGSKLTQVLKESFIGKNSRTVMVACVAPSITNCDHTLNTLRYADRVKERNAETGHLADSVAKASNIYMKPRPGPSSDQTDLEKSVQRRLSTLIGDNENEEEEDNWLSEFDSEEDEKDNYDEGIDELNEVLRSPVAMRLDGDRFFGGLNDSNDQSSPRLAKKEAVAPLVSAHRTIMTEMLGMVKQEMTLVNCTDADRELIDEYLDELEIIQDQQLSMISTLRESLVQYYAQRPSDDDDASYDDLRSPQRK